MPTARITRGNKAWRVQGTAESLRFICKQFDWRFDSIEDVPDSKFNVEMCKRWAIGRLIKEIGPGE